MDDLNMLDQIPFGEAEFHTEYEGKNYIVYTKGGIFFGRADVKDGICTKWETVYTKADFTYMIEDDEVYIPFEAADFIDVTFDRITKVLNSRMWNYLTAEFVETKINKAA